MTGIVRSYNVRRGYGFLHPLCGLGADAPLIFFHVSALKAGSQAVPIGVEVKFDLVRGERGPQAANVELRTMNGNALRALTSPKTDNESPARETAKDGI